MPTLVLTKNDLKGAGILSTIEIPGSGSNIIVDEMGDLLIKTGQTTSYRTGDDGDLEAGRATDFLTLGENNPFGNTNRFTDELGGSTYTNGIIIDWTTYDSSEVLGYYPDTTTTRTWNDTIDWAIALSVGTFTSGWRLGNIREYINIQNYGSGFAMQYAPFNTTVQWWTSNTLTISTTAAWQISGVGEAKQLGKTFTLNGIAVRNFTVTGTTLT